MGIGASFGKNDSKNSGSFSGIDNFTQNSKFTTTPTNPQFSTDLVKGVADGSTSLIGQDPRQFIAGPNTNLQLAGANAENLSGTPWAYDGATDLTRSVGQASAPDIASLTRSFMDPYLKQVVNATSADLDHSDNLARQQFDLQNADAFGGSGLALSKAQTEDALSRARATTLGGLRSQGFSTALGGAEAQAQAIQQQQQQRLQAANQIADLASNYEAGKRANIAAQDQAGGVLQSIQQQQAQAPLDFQAFLTQLAAGLPLQLFQGQTGTEDQTGTEQQSGTQSGKSSGTSFGFGFK